MITNSCWTLRIALSGAGARARSRVALLLPGMLFVLAACAAGGSSVRDEVSGRDASATVRLQVETSNLEWMPLQRTNDVVGQLNGVYVFKLTATVATAARATQLTAINVRGGDDQLLVLDDNGVVRALRNMRGRDTGGKLTGMPVMEGSQRVAAARTSNAFCIHGNDGRLHFYCDVDATAPWETTAISAETVASTGMFDWSGDKLVTWDGDQVLSWNAREGTIASRLHIDKSELGEGWEPVALDASAQRVAYINRASNEVCRVDYSVNEPRRRVAKAPMDLRGVNFSTGTVLVAGDTGPRAMDAGPDGFTYWRPLQEPPPARVDLATPMLRFLIVEEGGERAFPNSFGYDFVHARSSPLGHRLLGAQNGGHIWFVDLEGSKQPFRCQLPSASKNWPFVAASAYSPNKPVFYLLTGDGAVYRFEYEPELIDYRH